MRDALPAEAHLQPAERRLINGYSITDVLTSSAQPLPLEEVDDREQNNCANKCNDQPGKGKLLNAAADA